MTDGVINVYKESTWTSGDVVNKLKGVLHKRHIGHGGTLDPDAKGVLPVCVGKATRLFDYITTFRKTYEARIKFGVVTDTQDASGNVISTSEPHFTESELDSVLLRFTGVIEQVPPMYSALHINGRRLYDLARNGESVELEPRKIEIVSLERISPLAGGECDLRITCGKGTYIRTLCHDIGRALGCGAYMKTLLRTSAAGLDIADALTVAQIDEAVKNNDFSFIKPIDEAISFMPAVVLENDAFKKLSNGNAVSVKMIKSGADFDGFARIYCDGVFFGIGEKQTSDGGEAFVKLKCMLAEVR